jgi:hypothetical protein
MLGLCDNKGVVLIMSSGHSDLLNNATDDG